MKLAEIRKQFIQFYKDKNHTVVRSSPLVPANDPTLLFTNAGMVQFKDVFLGTEQRSYTKAVSVQRCLRAGGKHNDLENVGYTARHHTFFEMLGNFSFGDYFKEEAISMAWEFLTEVIKLPKERLWVTVYTEDDESADIWLNKIGVDPTRFSRCGEKDNYWSMGDTGPCGPCTEIFYDHGPEVPGGPPGSEGEDLDRYIEIWNLVFMQYDRDEHGNKTPLPKPCVDTGMGIERLAAVVQGVHSNYEIDLFEYLIQSAYGITGAKNNQDQSLRVLADHIRACSFLIVDGVVPSNEGRGYVLRRIIRRAVRHGNKLGSKDTFFYKLVEPLCNVMGEAYPELIKAQSTIELILKQEEEQFRRTLVQGLKILNDSLESLSTKIIDGQLAFKLYDTYGFPIDLTLDIARERELSVDLDGFENELEQQRERSKQHSGFKSISSDSEQHNIVELLKHTQTDFKGYEKLDDEVKVVKLLNNNSQEVSSLKQGEVGYVITNKTPFYAEGGGQVGDQGTLIAKGMLAEVENTLKVNKAHLHKVVIQSGTIKLDDMVTANVDYEKRAATARNHSATHLLHAALRNQLGETVQQKGSYVGPDYLRFDFSYFKGLSLQELQSIEDEVNDQILRNTPTDVRLMDIDSAIDSGAIALFGEKYEDKVRVLNFGYGYSVELCGGTHVKATGDIGLFVITSETSSASGVRRIEAITGDAARRYLKQKDSQVSELAGVLKTNTSEVLSRVKQLQSDYNKALKLIDDLKHSKVAEQGKDLVSLAEDVAGVKVLVQKLDGYNVKQLRSTVDSLKSELNKTVVLLAVAENSKVNLIAGVTNNCTNKINASELINMVAQQLGGKGGGRPDMAQAGCKDATNLDQALASAKPWIKDLLNK